MRLILFISWLFSVNVLVAQNIPLHPNFDIDEHLRSIAAIIKYPVEASKKGIEGEVYVSFNLMESGDLEDIKILNPLTKVLDEEVLRTLKALNGFWYQPNGANNILVNLVIPIEFKIVSEKSKEAKEYYQEGLKYISAGETLSAKESFFEAVRRDPRNEQYVTAYSNLQPTDPSMLKELNNLKVLPDLDSLGILVKAYSGKTKGSNPSLKSIKDVVTSLDISSVEHFDSNWNRVANGGVHLRISNKHPIYGYNGTVFDYYAADVLFANSIYQLGKLNGAMTIQFPNGQKKLMGSFSDNEPTGRWKFYSEKGQLYLDIKIKNDKVKFMEFKTVDGQLSNSGIFYYDFINPFDGNNYKLIVPIEKGNVNGELKILINDQDFGIEIYDQGTYIKGVSNDNEVLQNKIFMPWIFIPWHFLKIETQN